jgi:hypothetical protein
MRASIVVCAWIVSAAAPAFAASSLGDSGGHRTKNEWGFALNLGIGEATGDFDDLFIHQLAGEFDFFHVDGPWRFGFGVNFSSFGMVEPYDDEDEWGYQRTGFYAQYMLQHHERLRPYFQVRAALARIHPRSELFEMDPLPEDFEVGDSPTPASDGVTLGLGAGFEYKLGRAFALDLSVLASPFWVEETDLSAVGREPASSGTTWESRLGVVWWPHGETLADSSDAPLDAWGLKPSYGWAAGEVLAINLGASAFNEYVRNANFNQISPRSWWENLTEGFHYDDNEFRTNQYIHPFNGACYFNSGRANGLDFWSSSAFGIGGAFIWEAFGETHPMSFNDMISTGLGGIALGEAQFRMASLVLDNTDVGSSRTWREVGAFAIDPIRGFNRLVSGRSGRVHDNPTNPMDWRPENQRNWLAAGIRILGEGESISENTEDHGFFEYGHQQGNVFTNTRRGPFDYFDIAAQLNIGDKLPLGKAFIRGELWGTPLGDGETHVFAITQHFEYLNNNLYEWGGQSYGPTLFSRFGDRAKTHLDTRVDVIGTVLGAVNSDYSFLAEVENRERYREYDYGPGGGVSVEASLTMKRVLLSGLYRFQYINVSNGSIYSTDDFDGSDADHFIQAAGLRAVVPVRPDTGVGADFSVFLRKSEYSLPVVDDTVTQRNPQVRVFLVWTPGRSTDTAGGP